MRIIRLRDYPGFLRLCYTIFYFDVHTRCGRSSVTCVVCVTSGIRASLTVALVVIISQRWLQLLFRSADNHAPCTIAIEDHVERSSPRFARFVKPDSRFSSTRVYHFLTAFWIFVREKNRRIIKRSIFAFIKSSGKLSRISILVFLQISNLLPILSFPFVKRNENLLYADFFDFRPCHY